MTKKELDIADIFLNVEDAFKKVGEALENGDDILDFFGIGEDNGEEDKDSEDSNDENEE